jgi:REP element-mobilizing transposase RayT
MVLSPTGKVVEDCWRAIPDHYKNVSTGVFVIMPDHFHGIIVIGTGMDGTGMDGTGMDGTGQFVGTGHAPSLQPGKPTPTIGNIVGSFKSAATKKIRETGCRDFGWQERFYDRVIRNADELQRIEKYIRMNPEKWR